MTKVVDRAIWSIGPVFIAIAILLLDMCVLAYYFVVFPYFHTWTNTSIWIKLYNIITIFFTLYVVYTIHFHYYMAITTSPGNMKQYTRDVTIYQAQLICFDLTKRLLRKIQQDPCCWKWKNTLHFQIHVENVQNSFFSMSTIILILV